MPTPQAPGFRFLLVFSFLSPTFSSTFSSTSTSYFLFFKQPSFLPDRADSDSEYLFLSEATRPLPRKTLGFSAAPDSPHTTPSLVVWALADIPQAIQTGIDDLDDLISQTAGAAIPASLDWIESGKARENPSFFGILSGLAIPRPSA
ncbi:hypothetical protein VDGL01_11464 [Verticillium dahliae]